MGAETYLKRYREAKAEIERMKSEIREVKAFAEAKGIDTTREPVQSNSAYDVVGTVAAKAADLESELREKIFNAFSLLEEIHAVITEVENEKERDLLTRRYTEGLSREQAAGEMYISRRNVWRIRERAHDSVEKY